MGNRNTQGESGMTKRLKIQGYVEIPDNMSAEDFAAEINGVPMFFNDHDLDTFKLHLEVEEHAADVVEVVRCKDCRHSEICPDRLLWCNECNMLAEPDGYCYRCERREVCEKD